MEKPKKPQWRSNGSRICSLGRRRALSRDIYLITRVGSISKDYALTDQIRRAAVSVMANIAEGFERGSRPDFGRFLWLAKASCAEVRSHLYVALDVGHLKPPAVDQLLSQANEVARIIGGLAKSLKRPRP